MLLQSGGVLLPTSPLICLRKAHQQAAIVRSRTRSQDSSRYREPGSPWVRKIHYERKARLRRSAWVNPVARSRAYW